MACIYNDTPVCDFKSWPGGKGAGKGAQGQWKRVIEEYGFKNEEEAMAYKDNPIDNLQPVVDARIPIKHIITEDDVIVPPKENTYVLKERLEKLGHPFFYVISIKHGKPSSNGHHFNVEFPHVGYYFIRKYSDFSNEYPIYLRSGLKNSQHIFSNTKKGRVGFLGDPLLNPQVGVCMWLILCKKGSPRLNLILFMPGLAQPIPLTVPFVCIAIFYPKVRLISFLLNLPLMSFTIHELVMTSLKLWRELSYSLVGIILTSIL